MQTRSAETQQELYNRLVSLQELHQQLAREIEQKEGRSDIDDLTLHRLKKEKLLAKDKIIMLQSQLEPDKRARPAAWQAPAPRQAPDDIRNRVPCIHRLLPIPTRGATIRPPHVPPRPAPPRARTRRA